ncbi:hypothetical protein PtrSN002B_012159, partial [Pyrenophora tritici-repentis]
MSSEERKKSSFTAARAWQQLFSRSVVRRQWERRDDEKTRTVLPRRNGPARQRLRLAHEPEHIAMMAFVKKQPYVTGLEKVLRPSVVRGSRVTGQCNKYEHVLKVNANGKPVYVHMAGAEDVGVCAVLVVRDSAGGDSRGGSDSN